MEIFCSVCEKNFKSLRGLSMHNNFITKYNYHPELEPLPKMLIKQLKETFVYCIHQHLPRSYQKRGKQTVSVPCTESMFFSVFGGNIHYYSSRRRFYVCIFRESFGYDLLSVILENNQWGKKYYDQKQQTYVVLGNYEETIEDNPLAMLIASTQTQKTKTKKYKKGEVIVEWRVKSDTDALGNQCSTGKVIFHFYISGGQFL